MGMHGLPQTVDPGQRLQPRMLETLRLGLLGLHRQLAYRAAASNGQSWIRLG
jgi:hypothetical protein